MTAVRRLALEHPSDATSSEPRQEPSPRGVVPSADYLAVLDGVTEALTVRGTDFMFVGAIASACLGRPRISEDIDIIVRPRDAQEAITSLHDAGFDTCVHDESWLYKARKHDVTVDVLFVSARGIYLDREMENRALHVDFAGRTIRVVGPEDLILMKALAHSEPTGRYWFDALGVIGRRDIDWSYLVRRARLGPRRMLSLLLYASSIDLAVPRAPIDELYRLVMSGRLDDGIGDVDG